MSTAEPTRPEASSHAARSLVALLRWRAFDQIVDALAIPREPGRRPLVSVLFVLQNAPGTDLRARSFAADVDVEEIGEPDRVCRFDLALELWLTPEGLRGLLRYSTALFERATAERIARMFAATLARVVADPDRRLSAIVAGLEEQR